VQQNFESQKLLIANYELMLQNCEKYPEQFEILKEEIKKSHNEKIELQEQLDKISKN